MPVSFSSFADFKRRVKVGMRFRVDNRVRPEASGERVIKTVQTNALCYWFTNAKGNMTPGWAYYPKSAKQILVEGERVSWLADDGSILWTYHSFEES